MNISVITLFPKMIEAFFSESIIKRAIDKKLVNLDIINLRDFAKDKYGTVDDKPYGGGAGMILKVEPIVDALNKLKAQSSNVNPPTGGPKSKIQKTILTSPKGRLFDQDKAQEYSKLDHLIIICGHYEGVDARVLNFVDEEVSLGDFVMTGGEIAAAAIVDSVVRLIKGVLKKEEVTKRESFFEVLVEDLISAVGENKILSQLKEKGRKKVRLIEYPQYTRPEVFYNLKVPGVLLSGNHAKIEKWRRGKAFEETVRRRKDLIYDQN